MATALSMSTTRAASGLGGSSLTGQKLKIKPTSVSTKRSSQVARVGFATAKYGEKSVYFDLGDIGNTTGNWDLYGSDAPSPYNGLQSQFFQIFAGAFTKRGFMLKFLLLGFAGSLAYTSASADPKYLPIKKGPQGPGEPGPKGRL